ncbi:hypothetical protein EYC84_007130 [Monilinia fructicola]|uniref:Uncharacterized protein n=1 Tax=Monilinia fructicola TaxID=38448 RepID=A0A5M9K9D6_MONFR|nr:hypothetical protein EYC84_007130 [Monilinia fructicola]
MENNEKYLHGRLDPGIESTLQLVEGVESPDSTSFLPSLDAPSPESSHGENAIFTGITSSNEATINFNHLPTSCFVLSEVAKTDSLWRYFVQKNVPGIKLDSPSPCRSFKDLYKAHDPHWFLPKHKIWFADVPSFGQLVIAKYDPKTGSIFLHRLVAEKKPPQFYFWGDDTKTSMHILTDLCHVWVKLNVDSRERYRCHWRGHTSRIRVRESNFMLAKSSVIENPSRKLLKDKWPPPNIPAKFHVDRPTVFDQGSEVRWGRPENRFQISEHSFRIRQWMDMNGQVRMGDEIQTWSTIDPKFYTPTEYSPYKGIFIGDYSGHGTEFLLIDHRDGPYKYDQSNTLERKEDESVEGWEARKKHARIYQGSLRAVKLTGDPNVPRGELTWIADDIGERGFVRFGEKNWPGARIVRSLGQIANVGYENPKYIETQLIMISHDILAQYWEPFGHISFFRRVNIDDLVTAEIGNSSTWE